MDEHTERAKEEEEATRLPVGSALPTLLCSLIHYMSKVKIAVWASLMSNFALCVLQREFNYTFTSSVVL